MFFIIGVYIEMVPEAGLEPAQPQWPGDFKSPVSTNFTTRAEAAQNTMKSERVNTFVASLSDITHPGTTMCAHKGPLNERAVETSPMPSRPQ